MFAYNWLKLHKLIYKGEKMWKVNIRVKQVRAVAICSLPRFLDCWTQPFCGALHRSHPKNRRTVRSHFFLCLRLFFDAILQCFLMRQIARLLNYWQLWMEFLIHILLTADCLSPIHHVPTFVCCWWPSVYRFYLCGSMVKHFVEDRVWSCSKLTGKSFNANIVDSLIPLFSGFVPCE